MASNLEALASNLLAMYKGYFLSVQKRQRIVHTLDVATHAGLPCDTRFLCDGGMGKASQQTVGGLEQ